MSALFTALPSHAAKDKLVIVSPHRESVKREFLKLFGEHYRAKVNPDGVDVEWLDQGGASDALRFVRTRFAKNAKTSGIDILWGGGEHPHYLLDADGLLLPYKISALLRKEVPQEAAGVQQYNSRETWHASALSSFGIFYNRLLLKALKLPEPTTWEDLSTPVFFGNVSSADPRRSSSNVTMSFIMLQAFGWDRGWQVLTQMGGNTRSFTRSSADPVKAVVSGDAATALAIGYFANAKISDIGASRLGFVLPEGRTIINPDPISILHGAPNTRVAEAFVSFVLSAEAQKLLLLPKGAKGGPTYAALARMGVNRRAYTETEGVRIPAPNPFKLSFRPLKLDVERVTRVQFVLADLIGTVLIDHHAALRAAWKAIIDRGLKPKDVAALSKMPLSEKDLEAYAKRWNDNVFRNQKMNEWNTFAAKKYAELKKAEAR